jgi:hypothetical protein
MPFKIRVGLAVDVPAVAVAETGSMAGVGLRTTDDRTGETVIGESLAVLFTNPLILIVLP